MPNAMYPQNLRDILVTSFLRKRNQNKQLRMNA
jgi:hypothetical protein